MGLARSIIRHCKKKFTPPLQNKDGQRIEQLRHKNSPINFRIFLKMAAPSKHSLPDDLKELIIETNIGRRVKFTRSQRLAQELVVEEYVMKKKLGPFLHYLGGRAVSWKCTHSGCAYVCTTLEGRIIDEDVGHNHPADTGVLVRKEVQALIREQMTSETDHMKLVRDLIASVRPELRDSLGSEDSLRQIALRRINSLKKGIRNNTEVKLFDCPMCDKTFSESVKLKEHKMNHIEEKPYICSWCDKSFSKPNNRERHQRIHTGDRPFPCSQCGKSFGQGGNLKTHERIHTREKPFSCLQCGKSFSDSGNYHKHQKLHMGESKQTEKKPEYIPENNLTPESKLFVITTSIDNVKTEEAEPQESLLGI